MRGSGTATEPRGTAVSRKTIREMGVQPALECLDPESHDELVITLPLPPRTLSPNAEQGTSKAAMYARARAKEEYRADCEKVALAEARLAGWRAPERARIHVEFGYRLDRRVLASYPKSRKPYAAADWDNSVASFKYAQDALRHAGVIRDDSWGMLEPGSITMSKDAGPGIRVRIERLA